jgi:hypothetical protein
MRNRILSLPNQEGRNVLHYLALSGGTALVSDLLRFFDQEHSDGRKLLTEVCLSAVLPVPHSSQALSTEDQRGFLPMHYAVMRFGSRSSFTRRLQEFHHWVGGFQFSAKQTQLLTELAAVHDSAIFNPLPRDQEHREREITVAADGSTVPEIKTKSDAWNGGWSLGRVADPKVAGDDTRCDIQEVHSGLPSPQEFFRDYFRKGMPVIFRGALQLQNHSMLSLFQREPFLESYGEDSIPVAQIPYAHTFGQQQQMVNFQEVSHPLSVSFVTCPPSLSLSFVSCCLSTSRVIWRQKQSPMLPQMRPPSSPSRHSMPSMYRSHSGRSGCSALSSCPRCCADWWLTRRCSSISGAWVLVLLSTITATLSTPWPTGRRSTFLSLPLSPLLMAL